MRYHRGAHPGWVPLLLSLVTIVALGGCQGAPGTTPTASASPTVVPAKLTVGLGYIPSVQFAQFYLAQQRGYYAAAGLDVTFQNNADPELITLVGQGAVDVGIGDGTSIIPAVSQGIPVRYVATIYGQFPNVVVARSDSGITDPAALAGHSLGTPGRYGSSWIMLQALLASAGLTPADLTVTLYPDYGQATALAQNQVDAITGFANNEPLQLAQEGIATTILRVDQITPLPGPGLIVGTGTLATKRDAVRGFIAATLRAMADITADPQAGMDATFAAVPDLASDPQGQRVILDATIAMWSSPYTNSHGLGAIDPDAWSTSVSFMQTLPDAGVPAPVANDQLIDASLLPGS
jgi:putative riboflavin transport system substrate-binding protein